MAIHLITAMVQKGGQVSLKPTNCIVRSTRKRGSVLKCTCTYLDLHAGECIVLGSNLVFLRVNGCAGHGLGFESVTFGGHWRSMVFDFLGVNSGA
jgi:hypothetical protein